MTAAETTEKLLNRCECLINRLNIKTLDDPANASTGGRFREQIATQNNQQQTEEVSYLDMTADLKHNSIKLGDGKKLL